MQILLETLQKHADEIKATVVGRLEDILTREMYTYVKEELTAYARPKLRGIVHRVVDELVATETFRFGEQELDIKEYIKAWLRKPGPSHQGARLSYIVEALVRDKVENIIRELTKEELTNLAEKLKDQLAEIMVEKLKR